MNIDSSFISDSSKHNEDKDFCYEKEDEKDQRMSDHASSQARSFANIGNKKTSNGKKKP